MLCCITELLLGHRHCGKLSFRVIFQIKITDCVDLIPTFRFPPTLFFCLHEKCRDGSTRVYIVWGSRSGGWGFASDIIGSFWLSFFSPFFYYTLIPLLLLLALPNRKSPIDLRLALSTAASVPAAPKLVMVCRR
jgi:hypothetical protein